MDGVRDRQRALAVVLGGVLALASVRALPAVPGGVPERPPSCPPLRAAPLRPGVLPRASCTAADPATRTPGRLQVLLGAQVDLNGATALDLVSLPGIGPRLAERILADRTAHGPFPDVASLARVRGIGPRTVEKLRPYLQAHRAP